jgi:hypothetical protein
MNCRKGGFGTVIMADLFFTNDSPHTVKDPEIAVITYGSSGTRISRKKYVITQTIPPFGKITVPQFNFGLVNSQVEQASVNIVDFSFSLTPKSTPESHCLRLVTSPAPTGFSPCALGSLATAC